MATEDLFIGPPSQIQERIASMIANACVRHTDVARVYLVGSVARGEQTPESDVDLWVHIDDSVMDKSFELLGIYDDLEASIPVSVDIISVTDPRALGYLWAEFDRDKVLVYERKAN